MPEIDPVAAGFDAWAEVYDGQTNPLLTLEQRVLLQLLPEVRGLDVLDAGCGTGRWLELLGGLSPRRLTGVDISAKMLEIARQKVRQDCELKTGDCCALPVEEESADLVLSSFVLSYVENLAAYADGIYRVLRPGGSLLLSDMHPATERLLRWKRSFAVNGQEQSLSSHNWSLQTIVDHFKQRGFQIKAQCEPGFAAEEQAMFTLSGRSAAWESAKLQPAIYILKMRKPVIAPRLRQAVAEKPAGLALRRGRYAVGPDRAVTEDLLVVNECIAFEGMKTPRGGWTTGELEVDLSGCLLLPGLINAHDHLDFGLFPRLGDGPYENAGQWAKQIHETYAGTIARYRSVPKSIHVVFGGLRNLLCGATTVFHHNPPTAEMWAPDFSVRVVRDFAWAHSCAFEPLVADKWAGSDPNFPFVIHAAEGLDEASAEEIIELDKMHVLSDRTFLVHALACSARGAALINKRGAGVILCPTSNEFLFHRSPRRELIRSFDSVLVGSDSPLTAAGDLLDEIRFLHRAKGIEAAELYRMVTTGAARALRLRQGEGSLTQGAVADILVVRDQGLSPAETLVGLTLDQLELVIVAGRIHLASEAMVHRLPVAALAMLEPLELAGYRCRVRVPVRNLIATAEQLLGEAVTLGGRQVGYAPAA